MPSVPWKFSAPSRETSKVRTFSPRKNCCCGIKYGATGGAAEKLAIVPHCRFTIQIFLANPQSQRTSPGWRHDCMQGVTCRKGVGEMQEPVSCSKQPQTQFALEYFRVRGAPTCVENSSLRLELAECALKQWVSSF